MSKKGMKHLELPHPLPFFDSPESLSLPIGSSMRKLVEDLGIEGCEQEYKLVAKFLLMYEGSQDTFTSYRRECERLCQWTWRVRKQPVRCMDRHVLMEYLEFIKQPPKAWIAEQCAERYLIDAHGIRIPNPDWRPFLNRQNTKVSHKKQKYVMGEAAMRASIAATSTFMSFLQQEGYIQQNPVMLLRQKRRFLQKQQHTRVRRKLSSIQWETLITTMLEKAEEEIQYERLVFIFSAFYLLGLRISELSVTLSRSPVMGDFYKDQAGRWWFETLGKGNKLREVAVPDTMLTQLKRYRRSLGLSDLPSVQEATPLLAKIKGEGGIGARQLRKCVQMGFDSAKQRLIEKGMSDEAESLQIATAHWLRHTAISHDVVHRPREHVRDDVGHESVSVTDRYVDIELAARHASAKHKPLVGSKD